MKKIFFVLLLTIFVSAGYAQPKANVGNLNLGFENPFTAGSFPDQWFRWGDKDYLITVDSTIRHNGNNSALITHAGSTENSFGCIAHWFEAGYDCQQIELRAYMKMENVSSPVGLMLRIDGNDNILQFDNMQQRNICGTADWKQYSVRLAYPDNAKKIYIGAILQGSGKLWVDDFEVFIDGVEISKAKRKETPVYKADLDNEFDNGSKIDVSLLSNNKIEDIKTIGLIWGFLKYYHPNIAKGEYNWDYELFRMMPEALKMKSSKERDAVLVKWIDRLGTFEVKSKQKEIKNQIKMMPDLEWITNSGLSTELVEKLQRVKMAERSSNNYYIGLTNGVGNPVFKNERSYSSMKYPDAGFRLLSLFRYWNIIQYYFPYKNLIGEDWKNVLTEFIPSFINAKNELEYKLAALELIGRVHDTHANINRGDYVVLNYFGKRSLPVEVKFIEGKLIVTNLFNSESGTETGLNKGDIIKSITGRQVEEIVKEKLRQYPASNFPTQLRNLSFDILRTNDSIIKVGFINNGKSHEAMVRSVPIEQLQTEKLKLAKLYPADTCFRYITSDIAYLYPGKIKNEYLPEIMKSVQNSKGLIIDFRCYPDDFIVFTLSSYLMPQSTDFVEFSNGNIETPGLFTIREGMKVGKENKDYYKGKVVILVNEMTQSSAEYHTMAFRVAPGAVVIGSTTAGADGNVSFFTLPGDIKTLISGIGVYYPDGKETQRVGIVPDIEVKPTIKGIIENRDEVLEKAIAVINGK